MATFKAVVQAHQKRRDEKFPVTLRITHNRKSCYVSTGLYCTMSQINRKTFEIKDQFIIARTTQTMREWERKLLTLDVATLSAMSTEELKKFLLFSASSIDYLGYCYQLIHSNPLKYKDLKCAVNLIEEMGIKKMTVMDFTSSFLRKYKDILDNRTRKIVKNGVIVGHKHYSQETKRHYFYALGSVFRMLQREYNTEFNNVIYHNPFCGVEVYRHAQTAKRSMSAERIKAFFDINVRTEKQQMAVDLMKLSFCLCGMNLMDLLAMEKANFDRHTMRLTYNRHKTGVLTSVHIEPEIVPLVEKYMDRTDSKYLFSFARLTPTYNSTQNIGAHVVYICHNYNFEHITPYWFRHSFATIARNDCDISKDDIDLCLAHVGNNPMADVYIKPDWSRIDRANRKVLDFVFGNRKKMQQM